METDTKASTIKIKIQVLVGARFNWFLAWWMEMYYVFLSTIGVQKRPTCQVVCIGLRMRVIYNVLILKLSVSSCFCSHYAPTKHAVNRNTLKSSSDLLDCITTSVNRTQGYVCRCRVYLIFIIVCTSNVWRDSRNRRAFNYSQYARGPNHIFSLTKIIIRWLICNLTGPD